ncbi:hypothetical protein [Lentilactobacillus sp. SPB1-3]|uniref:Uncharacterized protein n=1 Tax=Lentilactobacillus terminaliae TaxID=3003483 RepID=A0ACD5DDJ6_9LACO|nr:hypothetical protein [Lentilactobacillus sp. SPB1-3]MCZ0978045.1 hypothetical protein [Lentilactobacillus sp. SPB1-3]
MRQSLKPLSDRAVKQYLKDFPDASFKWGAFIEGAATLSTTEISEMTAPELSVLRYAMNERNKSKSSIFEAILGG